MSDTVNIDDELCAGCGACVDICPQHILYLDGEKNTARVTDGRLCDRLKGCEKACPAGAIRID